MSVAVVVVAVVAKPDPIQSTTFFDGCDFILDIKTSERPWNTIVFLSFSLLCFQRCQT